MTQVMVCNRWPLELIEDGQGGHFQWYKTYGSKPNAECILELIEGLPEGMSLAEHFAGIGEASIVFQNILKPSSHWASDLDSDCVRQLRTNLPASIQVSQNDAKDTMGKIKADFISLDFDYFTARYHDNWPWAEVFALKPKYVEFADCGKRRIGLHRGVYAKVLGVDYIWDYADYTKAYSDFFSKKYGYHIDRTASRTYSYHLLVPDSQ